MKFVPVNLNKPVQADGVFLAAVDDSLFEAASKIRWITIGGSPRPVRAYYDAEKGRGAVESMARWVWAQSGDEVPRYLAHIDSDLLNCTRANLKATKNGRNGSDVNTGACVKGEDPLNYRPKDPVSPRLGRPIGVSDEQRAQLKELRASVGQDMSLTRFNREIVKVEIGRLLSWKTLNAVLS